MIEVIAIKCFSGYIYIINLNYEMPRSVNIYGGGSQTNLNGLNFEQTTSLRAVFENHPDFEVEGNQILKNGEQVGHLLSKNDLYKFLERQNVDHTTILSKKMLPDDAILVDNTLYIIEKKFQNCAGSVDEKIQTCDFKKKQYTKLLAPCSITVEYYYFFNDWFLKKEYKDVKEYILSVGCKYFFDEIPLSELGLE